MDLGYFVIPKILKSPKDIDKFYDVWIVPNDPEDAKMLKQISYVDKYDIKCCWEGGLGTNISSMINGMARIVSYQAKKVGKILKVDFPIAMWEGQVKKGIPYGFNRYINADDDSSFVGFMVDETTTDMGLGMYF